MIAIEKKYSRIHSLPIRDGNMHHLALHLLLDVIHSLPIRDGNFG